MDTIRNYGAIPFFSWGSHSIPVPGDLNEPDFQLADIFAGSYDAYIREFAEGARDWGHPFFLRFNWEMNGDWFPWAEGVNGNQPGEYVAAWRHVHDIFTAVGADNATWVWCPYADPTPKFGHARAALPGRRIRRLDLPRRLQLGPATRSTRSPGRASTRSSAPATARSSGRSPPAKPMLLAEMASDRQGHAAKSTWIDEMFKPLRTKYRRIRGLIWFEQIDRGVQWPLETAPTVTGAFAAASSTAASRATPSPALAGPKVAPPR